MSEVFLPALFVTTQLIFILILVDCLWKKVLQQCFEYFVPTKKDQKLNRLTIRLIKRIYKYQHKKIKLIASNVIRHRLHNGLLFYSKKTEEYERQLFHECKKLREALGTYADANVVLKLMVQLNLHHPHDLHGRRRTRVTLEFYQMTKKQVDVWKRRILRIKRILWSTFSTDETFSVILLRIKVFFSVIIFPVGLIILDFLTDKDVVEEL